MGTLTCKGCGGDLAGDAYPPRPHPRTFIHLRTEEVEFRGDHEREHLVDAGVFCSNACVARYLGGDPAHLDLVRALMLRGSQPAYRLPDHACAACVPGGSMVQAGFRCAYHRALDVLHADALREDALQPRRRRAPLTETPET